MCILNNPRRFALLLTPCARAAWSEVGGLVLAPAGDTVLLQVCVCVCVWPRVGPCRRHCPVAGVCVRVCVCVCVREVHWVPKLFRGARNSL
jgi:hypothetical protein